MASQRTIVGAAAFSLALAAGGVAGAVLGTPALSAAQDGDTSTDTTATDEASPDRKGPGHGFGGDLLATAAEALGMTEDELRSELEGGKSIAAVAEEQGVDERTVVDALVAASTERLEDAIEALPERMADLVEREGLPDRGRPGHAIGRHLALDAAADAIGISTDELRTELQGGATIAEVAADHDVEAQAVIDAMVAEAHETIDAAVDAGRLDADEAADAKANAEERITTLVNEGGPAGGGPGGHGGPGPFGGFEGGEPPAEATTTS